LGDGWQINVRYFLRGAEFSDEVIFDRIGRGSGYIKAIDRETEEILWETEKNVISNVAATKSTAYFLTLDGRLVGLDARSGEIVTTVEFEPAPFILNGPNANAGGYFVAVDEDAKMLYVQLGDSYQLFAFRIE
jgi:glucose dehydrogenase